MPLTADDWIFAIDFSHEDMTASFVSAEGREEGTAGFDLCDFVAGESRPLDKLLALLAAKAKTAPGPLRAAALSLPCDLDPQRRTVTNFPEAGWLNGQPLPEIVEKALEVPALMERRAVVSLCYDRIMLGLPEDGLIVGCYIDMHYENALWYCGAPLVGRNGTAGTIAHMTIHDREDNCFCGKTGCVDLYGAGIRLRQMHTMIFPDTRLDELFVRHGEHPLVRDYLTMMAYPIAIEANILDPDYIILGGSIPGMPGFPRQFLESEISRLSYRPSPEQTTRFLPSSCGGMAGVLCLAQYAFQKIAPEPAS